MFGIKFKNKVNTPNLNREIIDNIAAGNNVEKAVITYILLQARENNISLAIKDKVTFISFKNDIINEFLKEWFSILKLYQHNHLSPKMYETFIKLQLLENDINSDFNDDPEFI